MTLIASKEATADLSEKISLITDQYFLALTNSSAIRSIRPNSKKLNQLNMYCSLSRACALFFPGI
jgi:hypothetical protein